MSIIAYMKAHELSWQPSFSGEIGNRLYGYRGALIIEAGKQLSPDRTLPPKIQARQVLLVSKETHVTFFSCELDSILHFELLFDKYKAFFLQKHSSYYISLTLIKTEHFFMKTVRFMPIH